MQLLCIRHGIAVDRSERPDADRALTPKGHAQMKEVAAGLKKLVGGLELVAASPLVRAQQTAAIVAHKFGLTPRLIEELVPGAPLGRLLEWVAAARGESVAIVGHEDGLSTFVSWLISARPESHLVLKKGGAALVTFHDRIAPGEAMLEWLLTPKQLRKLG